MIIEIVSETEFSKDGEAFSSNYYIDIIQAIGCKLDTVKIYDTDISEPPFPRSIENIKALAMVRGVAAGVKYAEAFKIIKWIE